MRTNRNCRHHLAIFFSKLQSKPAKWFRILGDERSSDHSNDCLSKLLGMSENDFYIPLMLSCGLLRPVPKKKDVVPSINHIRNGFGYTWGDFFIEYNLDMEVSHIFECDGDNNRQTKHYFVRIGRFSSGRVTILEQLRQEGNNIVIKGIRRAQVQLIHKIAEEEIEPLSWPVSSSVSDHPTAVRTEEEELEATEKAASSYYLDTANENLSTLLKLHFFDRIVKDGKNSKEIWDLIDEKKLRSGVAEFIKAFHSSTYELQKKRQVEASSIVEPTDDDIPLNGKKVSDFPSLSQYGIPLVRSCIQPLMRDIYLLSKSSNATDLLTFPVFNGYTQRFHNCLQVFDFVFSKARQPSGSIDAGDIENLQPFITTALKLYRELGLKIPPKAHAIEDHLCEQLLRLKGTGDLGEDFVEQSHQDGIRKEARSRNARSREETAIMHCKWEHKQQLPEVLDKAKIAARKSVRTKRIADQNGTLEAVPITNKGDKKRRVAENKLTTRTLALQNTTEVDGVYLKSGRQINIDDTRRKVDQAQNVIQRNISSFIRRRQINA